MRFNSSLNRVVVLGILVIGAFVMPRTADAAVTACIHKANGNVRIVNNPGECKSNETPIALSTPGGVVTAVTASAPLDSSGGSTPDISLPNVIIGATNTAIGTSALPNNRSGTFNTASGAQALFSSTTGHDNTANGYQALFSNTQGDFNTASGARTLANNTTGFSNTANGYWAQFHNTEGAVNTANGVMALFNNLTGSFNTASGAGALNNNTTGESNTASGAGALFNNLTGTGNTAVGFNADVVRDNLTNATAIGAFAKVDASNKIRLGNSLVTVIEGAVGFSVASDVTKKENFRPVNGEEVLTKIGKFNLPSWNYIGHDPQEFRHYGPMAQEFFAAFGHDEVGTSGTPTTINSGDMAGILMIAVQALEKRSKELQAENNLLRTRLEALEKSLTK